MHESHPDQIIESQCKQTKVEREVQHIAHDETGKNSCCFFTKSM